MQLTQDNIDQINTKFHHDGSLPKQELLSFADNVFSSIDHNNGNEVFFISRKSARWLLNNLKHPLLTKRQVAKTLHLKSQYTREGNKSNWSNNPIKIDINACEVLDGVVRLYAVALCNNPKAVSLPIEFLGE